LGVVSIGNMMTRLVNQKLTLEDKVANILVRQFRKVKATTSLGQLSHILEKEPFALVVDDKDSISAIAAPVDLLGYISNSADSVAAKASGLKI
jgi:cystathionine beta-synthase